MCDIVVSVTPNLKLDPNEKVIGRLRWELMPAVVFPGEKLIRVWVLEKEV
jgi:hypothetical protein